MTYNPTIVLGCLWGFASLLATVCSFLVARKRTYYPLLRLVFLVMAGTQGGYAVSTLFGSQGDTRLRLISAVAITSALVMCVWFMVRRNRVPQWVVIDMRGLPREIDPGDIEHVVITFLSLARHGMLEPSVEEDAIEAVGHGRKMRAWDAQKEAVAWIDRRKRP